MRRARLLLVVIACLAPVTAARAADPWLFSDARARADARCTEYWYDYYEKARQILDANDKGNVDRAITYLRCAVDVGRKKDSGYERIAGGSQLYYAPYLQLARAFSLKADYEAAQACLKQERSDGLPKNLGPILTAVRKDVEDHLAAGRYLLAGERVRVWKARGGDVLLAPESEPRVAEIERLVSQIRGAATGAQLPNEALGEAVKALCRDEMKRGAEAIDALQRGRWKDAVQRGVPADRLNACRAAKEQDDLRAAGDALEGCFGALAAARRAAGSGACQDLAELRKTAADDSRSLATWLEWEGTGAGGQKDLPALPPACAVANWDKEPAAALAAALDGLNGAEAPFRTEIAARQASLTESLARKRDDLRKCLGEQRARLPEIPEGCTRDLELGAVAGRLRQAREHFAPEAVPARGLPPKDLVPCGRSSDTLVTELRQEVGRSVEQLLRNEVFPGVDKARMEALRQEQERFAQDSGASLKGVCDSAREAANAVGEAVGRNVPMMKEMLGEYAALLTLGRRTRQGLGSSDAAADSGQCFDSGADTLMRLQRGPGSNVAAWAQEAGRAQQSAQACLDGLGRTVADRFAALSQTCQRTREDLAPLLKEAVASGASAGSGSPAIVERARKQYGVLQQKANGMTAVEALYKDCPQSTAPLREALAAASIPPAAPEQAWGLMSGRKPDQLPDTRLICAGLRDASVAPWIAGMEHDVTSLEQVRRRLDPYLILAGILGSLREGDPDGAVRLVRDAQGRGRLPTEGRGAALTQTAFAYALFLKQRMLAHDGAERRVLDAVDVEARGAAGLALRAEAGFRPSASLFPGETFKQWFEETARR